jgi:hypothetical protein
LVGVDRGRDLADAGLGDLHPERAGGGVVVDAVGSNVPEQMLLCGIEPRSVTDPVTVLPLYSSPGASVCVY